MDLALVPPVILRCAKKMYLSAFTKYMIGWQLIAWRHKLWGDAENGSCLGRWNGLRALFVLCQKITTFWHCSTQTSKTLSVVQMRSQGQTQLTIWRVQWTLKWNHLTQATTTYGPVAPESFLNWRKCCKSPTSGRINCQSRNFPNRCTTKQTFVSCGKFLLINLGLRALWVVQVC